VSFVTWSYVEVGASALGDRLGWRTAVGQEAGVAAGGGEPAHALRASIDDALAVAPTQPDSATSDERRAPSLNLRASRTYSVRRTVRLVGVRPASRALTFLGRLRYRGSHRGSAGRDARAHCTVARVEQVGKVRYLAAVRQVARLNPLDRSSPVSDVFGLRCRSVPLWSSLDPMRAAAHFPSWTKDGVHDAAVRMTTGTSRLPSPVGSPPPGG
jgi:hypothetical protein